VLHALCLLSSFWLSYPVLSLPACCLLFAATDVFYVRCPHYLIEFLEIVIKVYNIELVYSMPVDWRFDWSSRTCLSTAVVAFLALYVPTKEDNFPLEFAAFVCILLKDSTFGATVKNGFACLLASAVLTFICWALIVIADVESPLLFLFIAVILASFFQYIGIILSIYANIYNSIQRMTYIYLQNST
jgi:hypothetical protein